MNSNWINYFSNFENKYDLRMATNKPIVIFVDGKDITKSFKHDLIDESKNSFNDVFDQTIKYFSKELECIAISGVDEVSFILEDSKKLLEFIPHNRYRAHEIVSVFSQHFCKYFNDRYKKGPIYWHCKCSNIPKGKIKSYIKYRSLTIFELNLTYFLKRRQVKDAGKIALSEKVKKYTQTVGSEEIENEKGNLYICGQLVDLQNYLDNSKVTNRPELRRAEMSMHLDIEDF